MRLDGRDAERSVAPGARQDHADGAILLILGWKVAGYVGADYYLLRFIGTPWHGKPVAELKPAFAKPGYSESSAD